MRNKSRRSGEPQTDLANANFFLRWEKETEFRAPPGNDYCRVNNRMQAPAPESEFAPVVTAERKMKVLLVDDIPENLSLWKRRSVDWVKNSCWRVPAQTRSASPGRLRGPSSST